ncbi:response regulator transcription factor [Pseudomonas oryzihabitans]|uniref:response regulator transcription factor n=1 Tax=Pseudomonas oryzihabitans TaxID=47885 RepID=UPI00289596CB|nr:response regulator transcription factor [Pseudomonas oryzihabitans]MDT3721879.1 response regulator transcription factor [Pseudomonas oryzihabitans]
MDKPTTLLLIDDHALFRSGIALVLAAGLPQVTIEEACSLEDALHLEEVEPQLVLLDVQLQGASGLEGIAAIREKWPQVKIVMVSAFDLSEVVREAVRRGALEFISKTEQPERLLQKIRALLDGVLPEGPALAGDQPRLTPRQIEVLELVSQGLSNKMIGRRLNLSEHTVRGHVQALLATLRVASRAEATYAARRLGLIL